jgi:hypothetical protein
VSINYLIIDIHLEGSYSSRIVYVTADVTDLIRTSSCGHICFTFPARDVVVVVVAVVVVIAVIVTVIR